MTNKMKPPQIALVMQQEEGNRSYLEFATMSNQRVNLGIEIEAKIVREVAERSQTR